MKPNDSKGSGRSRKLLIIDRRKSPTVKALRIGEILQAIFTHIPTDTLLSSCSLVNKIWNTEVRLFIRDHRICKIKTPRAHGGCKILRTLDGIFGEITECGRVIPFNCLEIDTCSPRFSIDDENTSSDDISFPDGQFGENEIVLSNFSRKFKLKYLKISGRDCRRHDILATLLKNSSSQLKILRIESPCTFVSIQNDGWHPKFPRLEGLIIEHPCFEDPLEETNKEILPWMLKDAPNLKIINVKALDLLDIVPDEMLSKVKLVGRLDIRLKKSQDISLFAKISQIRSFPSHIRIYEPRSNSTDSSGDILPDLNLRRKFDFELKRILQNYHQSLKTLEIIGCCPLLARLSHPPLSNVSKFTIRKRFPGKLDDLWNTVASINFQRAMPNLREVNIAIQTIIGLDYVDLDYGNEWPMAVNNDHVIYGAAKVRKLTLDLQIQKINLTPIQALFPNISVLHLHLKRHKWSDGTEDFGPLKEIWKCWPQLEELKFFGTNISMNRNYDLDFCGIHQEEASLLMQKDVKYLQNVHIVPIKPCLLTMPELRKLGFEGNSWSPFFHKAQYSHQVFISKLTHFLAFNRMPYLDLNIPKEELLEAQDGMGLVFRTILECFDCHDPRNESKND